MDMTRDIVPHFLVTVEIIGMRKWKARLWVAIQCFKLGSKIANMGIKFEDKPYYGADL